MKKRNKFSRALYSLLETTSKKERFLLGTLALVMVISSFALLDKMIFAITKEQPIHGGTYSEGIVGTPKFINPVLATSQIDKDLSRLVYSGLLRKTNFGTYESDLGSCVNIATKNVTCTLRDKLLFSDGKPLTAEDVVFTIELLKDLSGRNPQGSLWLGIEVKALDEKTVSFVLPQGYSGFQDLLTQGIIPEHIWQGQTQEDIETSPYNLEPVGSGPYKVTSLSRGNADIKASVITLKRFKHYHNPAYLEKIIIKTYEDTDELIDALKNKKVDGGLIPEYRTLSGRLKRDEHTLLTSQMFALFINQKTSPELQNMSKRESLVKAIEELKKSTIWPEGLTASSEIIPDPQNKELGKSIISDILVKQEQDSKITQNLEISTSRSPDLIGVSEAIAQKLSGLGTNTKVTVFERGELVDQAVRNRNYSLLVFGHTYRHPADVFAFWHSSQRLDPGLNITSFASQSVDSKIEAIMKDPTDTSDYELLQKQLLETLPVIPLFQGTYQFILPSKMHATFGLLASPEDRFNHVTDWYVDTIRSPFGKQNN